MHKKRFFVWVMIAALLFSLVPTAFPSQVQAAATFFIPSDTNLKNTATTVQNYNTDLTRDKVFVTSQQQIEITGTYNFVAKDSMTVKVEQLSFTNPGGWVTDVNRTSSKTVTATGANTFSATAVPLYAGYNKITFNGVQGGSNKFDTFYVLYDEVPILNSMQVTTGSNTKIPLNQGASIVVETPQVYVEGQVTNASQVSINGRQASVLGDGSFFAPPVDLQPGINILKLNISNGANKLDIERTIYYFDKDHPFNSIELTHTGETSSILNNVPTLTKDNSPIPETGTLKIEMLVPYSPVAFKDSMSTPGGAVSLKINNVATAFTPDPAKPTQDIPGSDGVTPAYRLVNFTTANFNFQPGIAAGTYAQKQTVTLDVYDTGSGFSVVTLPALSFKYIPNDIVINNMSLINDSTATPSGSGVLNIDNTTGIVPLKNSEVQSPNFYVLVEASAPIEVSKTPPLTSPATPDLTAKLLPLGNSSLKVEYMGNYCTAAACATNDPNKKVYKISDLPSGAQSIEFRINGKTSTYQANINYVSKNYISVDNLVDGQTIEFDSRLFPAPSAGKTLDITGGYIGNDNLERTNSELFVNGVRFPDFDLKIDANNKFNLLQLQIGDTRPQPAPPATPLPPSLSVGENRLVFTGTFKNGTSVSNVTKEIRIYVVDKNAPVIEQFQPVILPTTGRVPLTTGMSDTALKQVFLVTPDILLVNNKWTTSEMKYDLVFKGAGVNSLVLSRGSQPVLSLDPSKILDTDSAFSMNQTSTEPAYDFAGSKSNFVIRVKDLTFDAPGSQVYTLELTNPSGARTNQRLEIERVLQPMRVLSPQPTVGDRVVVNRNYVHFDIEAEGATAVTVDGKSATKRADYTDRSRFVYDFIGLKPDKENAVKIQVTRPGGNLTKTVNVYYTSTAQNDSSFMAPLTTKQSVFSKNLELTFPKGTVLKTTDPSLNLNVIKYYDKTNLLFGIADPNDGVIERKNDYGNIINKNIDERTDARQSGGGNVIGIPSNIVRFYTSEENRRNFGRVSPVYWISGGAGERGDKGASDYLPATNGLPPYSVEGSLQYDPERKVIPTNRGELTLKYDDNVVDAAGTTVTVFFLKDMKEWVNVGGKVDTKNHTITVPFDDFGYYMVAKLKFGFTDVTNHPWARNVLEALFSKGIMPYLNVDRFGADDLTSRGEFATLLVKALNIPLNYDRTPTFFEIGWGAKSATWSYEYIETAARAGIITGLDNRFFGADIKLNRAQAATMIARALELKLAINDDKLKTSLGKLYSDAASFSEHFYAIPAIDAVSKAGIMTGKPNDLAPGQKKATVRFDPTATLTRAEAGQIAVRLLQKYAKTFPTNLN
jgi:hypothetical protein